MPLSPVRPMGAAVALLVVASAVPARGAEAPEPTDFGLGEKPSLTAKAAILVDLGTGQVLHEQAADEGHSPASLTKMMTALLVLERGSLEDEVVVSKRAGEVGESSAHLEPGDRLSLGDLLTAVLLPSANDASTAAAEHVSGSVEAFVAQMNARAEELGLAATHFGNPSGLPGPGHVSSARDLARLAREGMKHAEFRRLVATPQATVTRQPADGKAAKTEGFENHNRLILPQNGNYWPSADGVKTGFTREAGRCLAASATQDGWQLLCVVLGCKDSWHDAHELLQWGFSHFRRERVVTAGETTARVHVIDGSPPEVTAVAKSSVEVIVPTGSAAPRPTVSESYPPAPVERGAEVGELAVSALDGSEIRATLVATEPVRRSLMAQLRDHPSAVVAGLAMLFVLGAWAVHGVAAKAAGARRARVAARVRRAGEAGARDGGRGDRAAPGAPR